MKNIFVVYEAETESGKRYAWADKIDNGANLVAVFGEIKPLAANIFSSRKEAEQIADSWNAAYKSRGIYGIV